MNHASINQYHEVVDAFKVHKHLFPHIRQDYINRMIQKQSCIFQDGIVIMYTIYKRKNKIGSAEAPKSSCTIKQILNSQQGNGNASKVLKEFLQTINKDVYLSVRADNIRAIEFYLKHGFTKVGDISWSNGKIPGHVYCWKNKT